MSRGLLARTLGQAGAARPGHGPLTIDLDSTICETGSTGWPRRVPATTGEDTGKRGYHPLLAIAAGTGDVLMSRLRRGPGHHWTPAAPPTSCGRRWDGCATPGPTDDSRYGPTAGSTLMAWYPSAARWMSASPSPVRQHKSHAQSHRGDTRRCLDADSLLDGRRRRCGRDHLHPLPGRGGRRAGTAHRPAGEADVPVPQLALFAKSTAIMASSLRPGRLGSCSNWRLTIAATPR